LVSPLQPLKEFLKQDFFRYQINLRLSTTLNSQLVWFTGFEGEIGRPRGLNAES